MNQKLNIESTDAADPNKYKHLTDNGKVIRVLESGAVVQLEKTGDIGYLRRAEFQDEPIEDSFKNYVKVGDVIPVAVGYHDPDYRTWEVSRKAHRIASQIEMAGLHEYKAVAAKIVKSNELECTLSVQGVPANLTAPQTDFWSHYRVLFEAGLLSPGNEILVIPHTFRLASKVLKVGFPAPNFDTSKTYTAKVIYIPEGCQKKNKFFSNLYVLVDGYLARVESDEILDAATAFPVGSTIPVKMGSYDIHAANSHAQIDWEESRFKNPIAPKVGDIHKGIVSFVAPYGAVCVIENRVTCFVHKTTVTPSGQNEVDKFLHPGDIIEVAVRGDGKKKNTYAADFVRVVDPYAKRGILKPTQDVGLELNNKKLQPRKKVSGLQF